MNLIPVFQVLAAESRLEQLAKATSVLNVKQSPVSFGNLQVSGAASQFVTVVTSSEEFLQALEKEAAHIEVQQHLDLRLTRFANSTGAVGIFDIPSFVQSFRVRPVIH